MVRVKSCVGNLESGIKARGSQNHGPNSGGLTPTLISFPPDSRADHLPHLFNKCSCALLRASTHSDQLGRKLRGWLWLLTVSREGRTQKSGPQPESCTCNARKDHRVTSNQWVDKKKDHSYEMKGHRQREHAENASQLLRFARIAARRNCCFY